MSENFIKEKYNHTAKAYVKRESSIYQFYHHCYRAKKYLHEHKVDYVIDIGCGSGAVSHYLASKFFNVQFIGIDFSEELIFIAKNRPVLNNLSFFLADFAYNENEKLKEIFVNLDNALVLVHGAFEYYDDKSIFAREVLNFFMKIKQGALIAFFLNSEMIFRKYFRGSNKKYWSAKQAVQFFCNEKRNYEIKYRSFLLFDKWITKVKIFDYFFLLVDFIIQKLPYLLAKKISTTFEIYVEH